MLEENLREKALTKIKSQALILPNKVDLQIISKLKKKKNIVDDKKLQIEIKPTFKSYQRKKEIKSSTNALKLKELYDLKSARNLIAKSEILERGQLLKNDYSQNKEIRASPPLLYRLDRLIIKTPELELQDSNIEKLRCFSPQYALLKEKNPKNLKKIEVIEVIDDIIQNCTKFPEIKKKNIKTGIVLKSNIKKKKKLSKTEIRNIESNIKLLDHCR